MKRNILAVIVPALLVAGTANAAEIYNKDGNKVDLYGKAVGLHYFSKGNGENSYGGNGDMTYARLGFERLIAYVTGVQNVRDVIPFPRTPRNASF